MLTRLPGVPSKPGVYIFKDAKQRVLYVGKAKNLKNRLRNYFKKSSELDERKTAMMKDVSDFSFIVTGNELEALVLEANLIKQYKPRFNIILRDDKNYPYIKLTVNEEWPRLEVVRKIKKDGALHYGPYVPAGSMWEILAFIRRNFQIRDCRYSFDRPMRPCVQYQMGNCLAPCAGLISREEYLKLINEIKLFLNGKKEDLIKNLEKKMSWFSEKMMYEEAAKIRDRIKKIKMAWESQKVIAPELDDMDVIGFYREESIISFEVFFIRNGIMIGSKNLILGNIGTIPDSELMYTFLTQFYSKEIIPPSEIILPELPEELKSLEKWLGQQKGSSVKISSPSSGKKKELIHMACENALFTYQDEKGSGLDKLLHELKDKLKLRKVPEDIGAFDVSTISGNESVGSFVYWSNGEFKKDNYRRLKIKTVQGINDYSMIEETIERIIKNLQGSLPDLIIIDGGKGHLEIAGKVMKRNMSSLDKIPMLVAIAKEPDRAYLATYGYPVDLEDKRRSSLLLKHIRDEAHRFAIGYHKKLRGKKLLESPLEKIKGIGKKRRLELLRVFGSIEDIRKATTNEITRLKGFNKQLAEKILHELRRS
jgi:excinuclease ABC subunit C